MSQYVTIIELGYMQWLGLRTQNYATHIHRCQH